MMAAEDGNQQLQKTEGFDDCRIARRSGCRRRREENRRRRATRWKQQQLVTEPARRNGGGLEDVGELGPLGALLASGGAERSRREAVGRKRALQQWGPRAWRAQNEGRGEERLSTPSQDAQTLPSTVEKEAQRGSFWGGKEKEGNVERCKEENRTKTGPVGGGKMDRPIYFSRAQVLLT